MVVFWVSVVKIELASIRLFPLVRLAMVFKIFLPLLSSVGINSLE